MLKKIKIGTLVGGTDAAERIHQIKHWGFETYAINFWQTSLDCDLKKLAQRVKEEIADTDASISCVGVYGNPLADEEARRSMEEMIDHASLFGAKIVTGFAGGLPGKSVPDSMPRFKEVFTELAKRAQAQGLKIAFESCQMGGSWEHVGQNIAFCPAAWEMMFHEVPMENLGLQWEPAHQIRQLIDPLPQLRQWIGKIWNVHGKDAMVFPELLHKEGVFSNRMWCYDRTPGFGDTDWKRIISILAMHGFAGSIDIEGWHDPVFHGETEDDGQRYSLEYLKSCRGDIGLPSQM